MVPWQCILISRHYMLPRCNTRPSMSHCTSVLSFTEVIREHAEALSTLGPGFRDSGFTCCIHKKLRTMTDATVQIVPVVEEKRVASKSSVAFPQKQ